METINYNELFFIDKDNFSKGTYGTVRKCVFNGKTYALKEFEDPFYLVGKRRMLEAINEVQNKSLFVPKFWVKKDEETSRYLTDFCDGKDVDAYAQYPIKEKINLLKQIKNIIVTMHENGIIHADLIGSNIMVSNLGLPCIIDFDNASYQNHKTCIYDVCDLSQSFIKQYGVEKEMDIFLFNILTFAIINECEFYLCRRNIFNENFGYFNNGDAKKICDSLFLEDKVPNKDFLIDTIDEASLKC